VLLQRGKEGADLSGGAADDARFNGHVDGGPPGRGVVIVTDAVDIVVLLALVAGLVKFVTGMQEAVIVVI
jgi:hypothetical protein